MSTYASCPTALVRAPVDVVWQLLTNPSRWGEFFDIRVMRCEPPGQAIVGQIIHGESGPRLLHLRLIFQFLEIDVEHHRLGLDVVLPLGLKVHEEIVCIPIDEASCIVNYHCMFGVPEHWSGQLVRTLLRRELDNGPHDSLERLKIAAEARQSRKRSALSAGR